MQRWMEVLKMRLIDIEAEVCADCVCRDKCDRQAYCWAKAMQTVDAVPVVRCKDCKHYRNYPNGLCYLHTEPKTNSRGYSGDAVCVEPEDFCSYGERKEGAEC